MCKLVYITCWTAFHMFGCRGSSSQTGLRRELSEEPLQLAIGSSHLVADTPSHSLVSLAQMSLQSLSQQVCLIV